MGLLTDPGAGRGKLTRLLVTYHNKLCVLLYLAGIVWFVVLAHENFNAGTYFSENALLPGLVKGKFDKDVLANNYQVDLVNEAARYPDGLPYSWLLAKFRQLNLDAYTHNFTLNYPLGAGYKYSGRNVYAILRAPRSASTEALVLSAPYRPPNSVHPGTIPSIAIMLSLAKFFRHQKYWAKDIIFLITEHEQLGVQAWLEAYHKSSCGRSGVLEHGDMIGRGGAIQAAINLELHSERISHIDVKIEGLNGQLPNLDLVNLVHKMCSKENVRHTFKNKESINSRDPIKSWLYSFKTLIAMVSTQATGVPNGNHGLFHRFGIEAVTLEGFEKKGKGNPAVFSQMGRVLEGLFRSLNNLLERFHQSYFFYLLPATDKYISIGMYMPPLGLLCTALIIKAFALWLKMQEDPTKGIQEKKETEDITKTNKDSGDKVSSNYFSLVPVGVTVLAMQTIGIAMLSAPQYFSSLGLEYGFPADISLYSAYVFMSVAMLFVPVFTYSNVGHNIESWTLLNIVALLEFGTLLLCVSMQNFSLALLNAVIYVAPALWMTPTQNRLLSFLQRMFWLLLHPLYLMTIVVMLHTAIMFPEEPLDSIALKGLTASRQALMYSVVDSYIYANWIFPVATAILLPNWLLFWVVIHSKSHKPETKCE